MAKNDGKLLKKFFWYVFLNVKCGNYILYKLKKYIKNYSTLVIAIINYFSRYQRFFYDLMLEAVGGFIHKRHVEFTVIYQ